MQIIREKFKNKTNGPRNRICLRSNTYASTLEYFETLFAEALKDFPDLKKTDVEVFVYGGDRIKRMMGIEFNVLQSTVIPNSYEEVEVHPIL